jgi:hypothetical protein
VRDAPPGVGPPLDEHVTGQGRQVRQVAALERGMPDLPSEDATEGEMIRRLRGLLTKRAVGVGLHTMPQHAIRRPNTPLHCKPDVDP